MKKTTKPADARPTRFEVKSLADWVSIWADIKRRSGELYWRNIRRGDAGVLWMIEIEYRKPYTAQKELI